jgi:hypothetical protein
MKSKKSYSIYYPFEINDKKDGMDKNRGHS